MSDLFHENLDRSAKTVLQGQSGSPDIGPRWRAGQIQDLDMIESAEHENQIYGLTAQSLEASDVFLLSVEVGSSTMWCHLDIFRPVAPEGFLLQSSGKI